MTEIEVSEVRVLYNEIYEISNLKLRTCDFIGIKEDGYTLTCFGRDTLTKLFGFAVAYGIELNREPFKELIANPDDCLFEFASLHGKTKKVMLERLGELLHLATPKKEGKL